MHFCRLLLSARSCSVACCVHNFDSLSVSINFSTVQIMWDYDEKHLDSSVFFLLFLPFSWFPVDTKICYFSLFCTNSCNPTHNIRRRSVIVRRPQLFIQNFIMLYDLIRLHAIFLILIVGAFRLEFFLFALASNKFESYAQAGNSSYCCELTWAQWSKVKQHSNWIWTKMWASVLLCVPFNYQRYSVARLYMGRNHCRLEYHVVAHLKFFIQFCRWFCTFPWTQHVSVRVSKSWIFYMLTRDTHFFRTRCLKGIPYSHIHRWKASIYV